MSHPKKAMTTQLVSCPNCQRTYNHYTNWFGKICTRCGEFIPPEMEHPWVRETRLRKEKLIREAILSILKRTEGKNNAD